MTSSVQVVADATASGGCRVCGSSSIMVPSGVSGLRGVTSDCKPWPRAGTIAVCRFCGLIEKLDSADWHETIARVYEEYSIYHQSANGAEQAVFDARSGSNAPRSVRLLRRLMEECHLPSVGRLLDIGCGNGVLLRTVSEIAPEWSLAGADLDDRHHATVEAIDGVDRFYAGSVQCINDHFDLITMQHVLEHVPEPVEFLRHVVGLLNPGGLLFIQVPNIEDNPFDLMVVDHSSHFAPGTVEATVRAAGLRPVILATDWSPKELTVIAAADPTSAWVPVARQETSAAEAQLTDSLRWLVDTAEDASAAAQHQPFGVLGTSIAATWLGAMLGGAAEFFVDEDANRIGQTFLERPVVDPASTPPGGSAYVAFPPSQAREICRRLRQRYPTIRWLAPPEIRGQRADAG